MQEQVQQLIDLTEKGLTQMANSLGIALPQLWEILIKQQYVEAAQSFFGVVICLILWSVVYKKREVIENFRKGDPDAYDNFERNVILMTFAILFFVITVATFAWAMGGVGKIINPEYYAIQDIISFISGATNNTN